MKVSIVGLDSGGRRLDLRSDSKALELEEYTPYRGEVHVHVEANKVAQEIYMNVTVSGQAHLSCDRCLQEFDRTFSEKLLWIYTTQQELLEDDQQDVYLLEPGQVEVDLTEQVREALIVMLPIKTLCSEECKGLCPRCGADLNQEECTCPEREMDPRWAKLAELKDNL